VDGSLFDRGTGKLTDRREASVTEAEVAAERIRADK
jgi:hypothetical protein